MYFLLFLFLIYILFILVYILATVNFSNQKLDSSKFPGISVVVAIRNGEKSLPNLIRYLMNQNYSGPLEFILVDDESNDKTKDIIISSMQADERFKYF